MNNINANITYDCGLSYDIIELDNK